jgi:hypothetical protein
LDELPETLDETFKRTLQELDGQNLESEYAHMPTMIQANWRPEDLGQVVP